MHVTDTTAFVIETKRRPLVFVRVDTDEGIYGVGEADATSSADMVARRIVEMGSELAGADPHDRESLVGNLYDVSVLVDTEFNLGPNDIVNTSAISALDIALWDLVAKRAGRPAFDLLGGAYHGREIPVYANGWWQDCYRYDHTAPEEFASRAGEVVEDGYDALKFNPFGYDTGRKSRKKIDDAIARAEAVRDTVGAETDILIEGHKQFTAAQAIDVARQLESIDPTFFEEPTPPKIKSLEQVSAASSIPIASGESVITHQAFADLVTTDLGVFQPDPLRTGGITIMKKIANLADAVGFQYAPHNAAGTVGTAVSAHLATSCPAFSLLEVFEDYSYPDWVHELYYTDLSITNGTLSIPEEHGLGVDLDFDSLSQRGRQYGP